MKNKQDWEKEFDEMVKNFIAVKNNNWWKTDEDYIKDFIKKNFVAKGKLQEQITKAREEAYKEVIEGIKCSYPKAPTTAEHNNNIAVIDNAVLEIKQYLSEEYLKSSKDKK